MGTRTVDRTRRATGCTLVLVLLGAIGLVVAAAPGDAFAQTVAPSIADTDGAGPTAPTADDDLAVPDEVDVQPVERDDDIASRLTRIFEATEWFVSPRVEADEGVVFLRGEVDSEAHRTWAARLAGNTRGVTAVVNQLTLTERPVWDLRPAWQELRRLAVDAVRGLPLLGLALVLLALTGWLARASVRAASALLGRRLRSGLLRDVAARAVAVPVFLLGLYGVLRVSGLTNLAVTVLGGTGLLGLIVGFAFRDIAENFLASILISAQRPFARGDLIEVAGFQGFVQHVNTRSTLLMTLEGNHVQIPNATIYKQTITNFTANPFARFDFTVGIGYDDSIGDAQSLALAVLTDHPAVVADPEPLVLVDDLGPATVNLRVYFWVDIATYSSLKVRSAIIRLTKRAFDQAGISMPDAAREVVFPKGVPVGTMPGEAATRAVPLGAGGPPGVPAPPAPAEDGSDVNLAEDLASEAADIHEQARKARTPEGGADLLDEP